MEVKNVSETPFLFGFAPSGAEPETPSGEFAVVLAEVSESGTPLSTKAEVAGQEPIAPLQLLDSPELRQGIIVLDLGRQGNRADESFVTPGRPIVDLPAQIADSMQGIVEDLVQAVPQFPSPQSLSPQSLSPKELPPEELSPKELTIVGNPKGHPARKDPNSPDSLSQVHSSPAMTEDDHPLQGKFAPVYGGSRKDREVDLVQSITLESGETPIVEKREAVSSDSHQAAVAPIDLASLIQTEQQRSAQVPVGVSPAKGAELPLDAAQLNSFKALSTSFDQLATIKSVREILFSQASPIARLALTNESGLPQSLPLDGGQGTQLGVTLGLTRNVDALAAPLPADALAQISNGPLARQGTQVFPVSLAGNEQPLPRDIPIVPEEEVGDSFDLPFSLGKGATTVGEISAALRIVGITVTEESSLEPLPLGDPLPSRNQIAGPSSSAATLGDGSQPNEVWSMLGDAKGSSKDALPSLSLLGTGKQVDSVRQAVAHTWTALQKEAGVAKTEVASRPNLGSVSSGGGDQRAVGKGLVLTDATHPAQSFNKSVSVQIAESVQRIENRQPAAASSVQASGETIRETGSSTTPSESWSEEGSNLMTTDLVSSEIAPSQDSSSPIPSREGADSRGVEAPSTKRTDGRLSIEGNHSLLEIRSETVRKVAEHIDRLLVTRSKAESVIRMQPEELGSITMVVRNIKNDIEAVVTASDERVRELLHDSRQDLIHSLQQRGHSEIRVSVASEANSADRQSPQRESSSNQDFNQRNNGGSEFGNSSGGQHAPRDQDRQGSQSHRSLAFERERMIKAEDSPLKKSETFRRFQKVIDVAI